MTFLSDLPRGRYDAIVVGSGAAGGMSALVLARAGARVLMLEAGRRYDPTSETPMFDLSRDAPLRAVQTPEKAFGYYDATVDGGWTAPGEPYTTAPGSDFRWYRARMLGGRTNHWGRVAVRFGPYDFTGRTRDGLGQDWPIRYEDLAPYYDRAEALIGVFGSMDEVENAPASPPGVLQPPPAPRAYELFVKAGCTALGIPCLPTHCAVLTRPLGDRPACFYATACRRGCAIGANFQSPTVLLPPALATGRLDILTDAMAVEVVVDGAGRAEGVRYVDKRDRREAVVTARATILAAGALDTTRILLCSRNARFPDGLANGSGQLGRNLVDSPSTTVRAQFPALEGMPPYNEDGASLAHLYMPWWGHAAQARGELDFARGYHVEFFSDRIRLPDANIGAYAALAGGVGPALKRRLREVYGTVVNLSARGEMIANAASYCELDPEVRDTWGVPVLRFHFGWGEQELALVAHANRTLRALVERLGGRVLSGGDPDPAKAVSVGGQIIHEAGTARMGRDPASSVVDPFGQAWEVPNLFLSDAAVFASAPHKNPTLTVLALAWRNAEHVAQRLGSGSL